MTGDEEMSEKIFVNVFLDVYRNKMLRPTHTDLCLSLLRHTFKVTLKHLKEQGLSVQKQFNAHYPLINLFYFEQATIKEAAKKTERTKEEILHGLREEFNHFCNNCT